MVSEGKVDIPESFKDDLSDDCEDVAVPIAAAFPFITTGQRSSVGDDDEMTSESYDGTSESSVGTTVRFIIKLPFPLLHVFLNFFFYFFFIALCFCPIEHTM